MKKKYVVKHFNTGKYWTYNSEYGEAYESQNFETLENAEFFISRQDGQFVIETIYII